MNKSAKIPSPPSRKAERSRKSSDTAEIPVVKIPVRCPHCDLEQLCEFPEPVVVMALTRWNNMNLYVPCHDGFWSASRSELHAIRNFLGEAWLKVRAQSVVTPHLQLRIFA
jgi:hypothetical protein